MLWCVFVIVSPTDYQNILAELHSPAALHSHTHFLEPELPVTPNLSPVHHKDLYVRTDPLLLTGPQPLPWRPETGPRSRDSPPRSPPRPCDLVLPAPAVELPHPAPPKARKPHIALNDQLLLSEEEDRFYQEMELSYKPKSHPHLAVCELDTDVAFSTSSPSLTSLSSITPSSPERPQRAGGGQTALIGKQDVVCSQGSGAKMEMEKVAGMVAAESEGNVEKWLKLDLIHNVDRKCEMITKDQSEWAEPGREVLLNPGEGSLEKEEIAVEMKGTGDDMEIRGVWNRSGAQVHPPGTGSDFKNNIIEFLGGRFEGDSEEKVQRGNVYEEEKEGSPGAEDQAVAGLFPQAWEGHHTESGPNEEEEGDEELTGAFLLVQKEQGTERKKELKGVTKVRLEEILDGVEQTEKEVLSLVGWHSDSSSVNVEPPTPGRSVSSDLLDRRER